MKHIEAMQGYIRNTKLSSKEKEEKIPGIIYGQAITKNINLYIIRKEFMNFYTNVARKHAYSIVIKLMIDGKEYISIIRDIQWKKEATVPYPLHLDFFEISQLNELEVPMYVYCKNEDRCIGVKNGGKLQIAMKSCRVRVNPHNMPAYLEVDLANLAIGQKITPENLEAQYAHCNLHLNNRYKIASVVGK